MAMWQANAQFAADAPRLVNFAPRLCAFDTASGCEQRDAIDWTHFDAGFASGAPIGVDDGNRRGLA